MQSCFSLLFSTKHTRKHRKHTHTLDVEFFFFFFFLFWKAEHDAGLFCFIFVQGKRFPECFCLSISTSFVIRPARLTVGTLAPCYMVTSGDFLCSWWPCFLADCVACLTRTNPHVVNFCGARAWRLRTGQSTSSSGKRREQVIRLK